MTKIGVGDADQAFFDKVTDSRSQELQEVIHHSLDHHGIELNQLNDNVLISIMVCEDLQHVQMHLNGLSTTIL